MIERLRYASPVIWWRIVAAAVLSIALLNVAQTFARDLGQWQNVDPAVGAWFRRQMQPDNPTVSCCGEADAYEANEFIVEGWQYFAVITDTRDDGPLLRPHIKPGTRIYIPPHKMKRDNSDPNPTGQGLVFIGSGGRVWCFFAPGLI